MKKTFYPALRLFSALFLALTLLSLPSCSNGNEADIHDLLATVPAEADAVVVANLSQIVEQAGGKVKDGKITDMGELEKIIKAAPAKDKKSVEWVLSENSGIDCTAATLFFLQGKPLLTLTLNDVEAFRANVDKQLPGEWIKEAGDVLAKDEFKIFKNRLWICDENAEQIVKFMNLSETQSFTSNKYAETLTKSDDAVAYWASIDGIMRIGSLPFAKQAQARMGLGMFFKDAQALAGEGNIKDKAVELEGTLINSDCSTSKCELELSKIDPTIVASLEGNANSVFAIAVSQKLVKQLLDLASSVGGAMPQQFSDILSPLDGTIAFATQQDVNDLDANPGFRGAISTNGKNSVQLAQNLQLIGDVKADGNILRVSKGAYGKGEFALADVAKEFDGAWMGAAFGIKGQSGKENETAKSIMTLLIPDAGGLKFKTVIKF